MSFVVECTAPSGDRREKEVESFSAAEGKKKELKDLGFTDFDLYPIGDDAPNDPDLDAGDETEVVDHGETQQVEEVAEAVVGDETKKIAPEPEGYDLPDDGPSVDEDPLVWMPDEFTDTIDGSVAINRKGFEVLAHHYDIQCGTEFVPELSTGGRVAFQATAVDQDGDEYTAFASASPERGDDEGLLVEMADTRAYKRAVSRATGVGMVAVEELQNGMGGA